MMIKPETVYHTPEHRNISAEISQFNEMKQTLENNKRHII